MGFGRPGGPPFRIPVSGPRACRLFGNAVAAPVGDAVAALVAGRLWGKASVRPHGDRAAPAPLARRLALPARRAPDACPIEPPGAVTPILMRMPANPDPGPLWRRLLTAAAFVRRRLLAAAAFARRRLLAAAAFARQRWFAVALLVAALAAFAPSPFGWQPPAGPAGGILGSLLAAQAALVAFMVAISVFLLQGVRRDAGERLYREYVRVTGTRTLIPASLALLVATGAMMMIAEGAIIRLPGTDPVRAIPGLSDPVRIAALAFAASVLLGLRQFERAHLLANPAGRRSVEREKNKRDVRSAVQAFLVRRQASVNPDREGAVAPAAPPGPGEELAGAAVRALLDDAVQAMDERRADDFDLTLESIALLTEDAMDEIERHGFGWESPGSWPGWPPLNELLRRLYPFREAVIGRDGREYAFGLLKLDFRLLSAGVERRCGELFTAGLDAGLHNYEIASRIGAGDLRDLFRGSEWLDVQIPFYDMDPGECAPYLKYAVRHQERLLSRALHAANSEDFEAFRSGFAGLLGRLRLLWSVDRWPRPGTEIHRQLTEAIGSGRLPAEPGLRTAELYWELEQLHGIALMGLAGRALRRAAEGRLDDPKPYLDAARGGYGEADRLADDAACAIAHGMQDTFSWRGWELEGIENEMAMRPVYPQRYPLAFFSLRLLELAGEPLPEIDLRGEAQRALDWFTENAESLEPYVRAGQDADMETRREAALDALRAAAYLDEAARDEDVIRRPLGGDAVATFTADVYAAAYTTNAADRLFADAGAARRVPVGAEGAPGERTFSLRAPKGPFTNNPAWRRGGVASVAGEILADDVLRQLCEALDGAEEIAMPLREAEDFTRAADGALASLASGGEAFLVLAGDWSGILARLSLETPGGYDPHRKPQTRTGGELARYLGHSVIWFRDLGGSGGRRLYAVEPGSWGCLVRAPAGDGQELRVEVNPVSAERAAELLGESLVLPAGGTDGAVGLRKLQASVEILVAQRAGFRVRDPSRARCVRAPAASA